MLQSKGSQGVSHDWATELNWKWTRRWGGLMYWEFPGVSVVRNSPANARDTGSLSGRGIPHMLWSNKACAPQLLSLCSRAGEPRLLSPRAPTTEACAPRTCVAQQEKPPQWETHAPQLKSSPCLPQLEKACTQQWKPSTTKNKQKRERDREPELASHVLKSSAIQGCIWGHRKNVVGWGSN